MVYLDWAAGAPPNRSLWERAAEVALDAYANPSAPHSAGRLASSLLEEARSRCAGALGVDARQLFFTSGATESNNIVLSSLLLRDGRGSILLSGFEHASIEEPCRLLARKGFEVRSVPADRSGRLDPGEIARVVDHTTQLVAVMHVNNETGAVQPIEAIAEAVRAKQRGGRRAHVHTDLAQSIGRVRLDLAGAGIDSASLSGYKLGAPRGAGVLLLRKELEAIYRGGEQEGRVRPGTENLFAIWGATLAIEGEIRDFADRRARAEALKQRLWEGVREIPGAVLAADRLGCDPELYSPYLLSASFPPLPAEVLVRSLDDRGYLVSTGSACSSSRKREHRVLEALGYTRDEAASTIRISFGPTTSDDELLGFCNALGESVERLFSAVGK